MDIEAVACVHNLQYRFSTGCTPKTQFAYEQSRSCQDRWILTKELEELTELSDAARNPLGNVASWITRGSGFFYCSFYHTLRICGV